MNIVEKLAELSAKHKLIPFLGAGCSIAALNCDWDSIILEMQKQLSTLEDEHLEVAQLFVNKYGKNGLSQFLRKYLYLDRFKEEVGYCHMAVMCSGSYIIYTTNQDNVMELCMTHYGRRIRPVVTIENLVEAYPDECLYIKFHGDLAVPNSLVFTTEDYQRRMDSADNFLDIRIRSDLLGKQFLFLGYSFRDPNIRQLFEVLVKTFVGKLPPSYLVAYSGDNRLSELCELYGIDVIIPQELFPGLNNQEAFEMFLTEWNRLTFEKYNLNEIQSFFHPQRNACIRMLSPIECKTLERTLPVMELSEAIRKFRGIVDTANIPVTFEKSIATSFYELCMRCETEDDASEINGASFNLHLSESKLVLMQAAHVLSLSNLFEKRGLMTHFYVSMPNGFPESYGVVIGAISIELLRNWNRSISPFFQEVLSHLADYSEQYDSFGSETRDYCVSQYNYAWERFKTTLENPIKRQKRLDAPIRKFVDTNYSKIQKDLLQNLPFEFR